MERATQRSILATGPRLAVFLLAVSAASWAQTVTISEELLHNGASGPEGIAVGADGALWFTEFASNRIGRISTTGAIVEYPVPSFNSSPTWIAAGPDGSLWFTEMLGNKIGRITNAGVITEFPVPTASSQPIRITAGPDGALWFTENSSGKIGKITTTGVVTEFSLPAPSGALPAGIAAGPDGALWFAETGANKIGRISTAGIIAEFNVPANSHPVGITAGPDGALWFTEALRIGRITTAGVISEFPVPTASSDFNQITAGPDGALWFTEGSGNRIGRITTAGASVEFAVPTPNGNPAGIVSGPDGALWFTEYVANIIGRVTLGQSSGNPPAAITATVGTPQSTIAGTAFPSPLQATVTDANGNPLGGVTVLFTAPPSGASAVLSNGTALTNSLGVASVTATANNTPGSYTVIASVGALSASFSLTNGPPGPPIGSGINLAIGKVATQSSTFPGFASAGAASAVDGNTDGIFFDGSVTTTNPEQNAWWQVDLGASSTIGTVTIWNRTDCCGSRLSDYWVFISNTPFATSDTPATLQNRAGTFNFHQTSTPNPFTSIAVGGAQGRYLRVQLTGLNYLSLAEVQVFTPGGTLPVANLSSGRTATESSTYPGNAGAALAIDGNTDGNFADGSVASTNADPNSWWQIDLGNSALVRTVVIWNRTDCCGSRLGDYWVFVSDTPFGPGDTPATLQGRPGTFGSHQTTAPNPSTTLNLAAQGRYVRVQLSGMDYLSLAEVQVLGTWLPPPSVDLAQGKAATQSSTYPGFPSPSASLAVDANTDGLFGDGSVTATLPDSNNPWWQVDLGASANISSIVIWNRTDCCGSRLGDYWVFVSNTPFLATDTPATLQSRAGTFGSHQTTAPNPSTEINVGAQGRYVRVQLTTATYLSLAEVQVFGQ